MGSSGKGGHSKIGDSLNWIFDPAGTVINHASRRMGLDKNSFIGGLMNVYDQPSQNVDNVITGQEQFGNHKNWYGDGWLGDIMSGITGAQTTAQRKTSTNNDQLWNDWSVKNTDYSNLKTGGVITDPKKHKVLPPPKIDSLLMNDDQNGEPV